MKNVISRALVPVLKKLPALITARPPVDDEDDFNLVRFETRLKNRAQVERFLPDILGRALARIWIDQGFRERFSSDPKGTLADYGVFLPDNITIDLLTLESLRPQVVVYELVAPNHTRRRLLYLQLVMMAGK